MTRRSMVAVALTGALLSGCGLPLDGGVRVPGRVAGEAQEPGAVQKLPPGPQADAGPRAIVQGFLSAQSNPDDGHAIARQFLAPEIRDSWDDTRVLVRSPAVEIAADANDETSVLASYDVLASIGEDGSYRLEGGGKPLDEGYKLSRNGQGQLRLVQVPPGLRLTPADAASSFTPQQVFFLRESGVGGQPPRLVPDRVFLPAKDDPAGALVRRLLAGPSRALAGAVTSALPEGTALRSPVSTAGGVVTVDLTGPVGAASPAARQNLSAQLVWTLRGAGQVFTSLRLLVEGRPFPVEGAAALQGRDAWPGYDPARPEEAGALLLVRDGRLAALGGGAPASEATDGRQPVDAVVASPSTGTLALLTRSEAGQVVRVGPPRGPFAVAVSRGPVGSMSWGPGDDGLWVVELDVEPKVLLVPKGADGGQVVPVPYATPADAGPLAALKVSRDGARAAAVFGSGQGRQVFVGRVERTPDGPRLEEFRPVAPSLTDVADVTWDSGTSLVVLGALGTANRLPVRVAVDGSELEPVRTLGLDGEPETVTAAPGRPLVVGARLADRPVLFVEESGLFREPVPGAAPAYPG